MITPAEQLARFLVAVLDGRTLHGTRLPSTLSSRR